jgi:hypothetical protein
MTNHSQQPRNPTDNSLFSQIRTRIMTHETTGILPCRGCREAGLLHSLSPRDIAFSEGLNGFPRRSRWWISGPLVKNPLLSWAQCFVPLAPHRPPHLPPLHNEPRPLCPSFLPSRRIPGRYWCLCTANAHDPITPTPPPPPHPLAPQSAPHLVLLHYKSIYTTACGTTAHKKSAVPRFSTACSPGAAVLAAFRYAPLPSSTYA